MSQTKYILFLKCLKPNIYYFLNIIKDDNSHFKRSPTIVPMNIHKNIPASLIPYCCIATRLEITEKSGKGISDEKSE